MKYLIAATALAIATSLGAAAAPPQVSAASHTIYQPMSKIECARLLRAHPSIRRNVTINHLTLAQRLAQGCRRKITLHTVPPNGRIQSLGSHSDYWIEIRGGFGIWTQKVTFGYSYDGVNVAIDWMSCTRTGVFYTVTIRWCGAYNSGGTWMDVGSDFSVALIIPEAPINRDFYQRIRVGGDGSVSYQRGGPA